VTVALAIVCGLAGAGAWAFGERLGAWTLRVAEKRADAAKWRAAYTKELDHSADLHAQLRMAKAEALGTESQLRAEIRALTTRLEGRLPPRGSGHPKAQTSPQPRSRHERPDVWLAVEGDFRTGLHGVRERRGHQQRRPLRYQLG
jgi:hypothetical protein